MMRAPVLDQTERRKHVGQIIRDVLAGRDIHVKFDEQSLHIHSDYIAEPTSSRTLSDTILDRMFPRCSSPSEFLHYTSAEGLKGIARSGELRLFPVRRRIGQGEIDTFAEKHRLHGYLRSTRGEPLFKELSDNLFYTSFTDMKAKNASHMWNVFARDETGACLRIRLTTCNAELRAIQYDDRSRTLLEELGDQLKIAGEPAFLPWTISKIGAFYLPSTLFVESEIRLLVKRHKDRTLPIASDHAGEYLPIRIGSPNAFCQVDVVEVTLGRKADGKDLTEALKGTSLRSAPIKMC